MHLLRPISTVLGTLVVLGVSPTASSQSEQCEPGIATLVGASDVVVRAVPVSMVRKSAGGMVYARGKYRVVDQARGGVGETVTVEFSCIDMKAPSGTDDVGHCPGGEGVVLGGFEEVADQFRASKKQRPMFLSRAETSPLDGATVHSDVTFRPFTRCADRPQDFESPQGEWDYVVAAEKEQRPSSPVEDVTKKAAELTKKRETSGCR